MNVYLFGLAEADLVSGFHFYEGQSQGVGDYFLQSLYSDIQSLRLYAGIHRKKLGYFCMLSRRFPYAIYYQLEGNEVWVWRVLDCRRDPEWIHKQLKAGEEQG